MKTLKIFNLIVLILLTVSTYLTAAGITGAGSSFIYPLITKWAYSYEKETKDRINYQSIGSGGGIRQIIARTVDFGASDAPLEPRELEKNGLLQYPIIIGAVVITYNLPELKDTPINLDGETVCGIFTGTIKQWDDVRIQKLNPKIKLPARRITVVHRSDGSGTTWIFTNWLSKVCSNWKNNVGFGTSVNWPIGIGAKGNEGVANYIKRTAGSIGYVEFIYAKQSRLPIARIKNRAGNFVEPTIDTVKEAAATAKWSIDNHFYTILTDQPGKRAYPLVGATFIIIARDKPEKSKPTNRFFQWALTKGDKIAEELFYVPLPGNVKDMIYRYWDKNKIKP